MRFTQKDFWFSTITGLETGLIIWLIADFLNIGEFFGLSWAWLILAVPVLWMVGINLGYLLGRVLPFLAQFGRFVAVGFTNAAVDFGVLNLLIALTGIATGSGFSVFKAVSFIVANVHSYAWNKYWVFDAAGRQNMAREFTKFFIVSLVSLFINVLTASIVVDWIPPQFGLDVRTWANVGAIAGSATALVASFVGYRVVVFRQR